MKKEFIIAVDIGNTNMVFCIINIDGDILQQFRIETRVKITIDELFAFLVVNIQYALEITLDKFIEKLDGVIVSSVVRELNYLIANMMKIKFRTKCIILDDNLENKYKLNTNLHPHLIGADFIANSAGVFAKYKKDSIVIDFGTATTIMALECHGQKLLGRIIAPGIASGFDGLINAARGLHNFTIEKPGNEVLYEKTIEAMKSGAYYGYLSMAESMTHKIMLEMRNKYGITNKPCVILTGGFSRIIDKNDAKFADVIDYDLMLIGLFYIYRCLT